MLDKNTLDEKEKDMVTVLECMVDYIVDMNTKQDDEKTKKRIKDVSEKIKEAWIESVVRSKRKREQEEEFEKSYK
jgi:flagellin-specific chaperone FliS